MNDLAHLNTEDSIQHAEARFQKGLAWLLGIGVFSCCASAAVLITYQKEIGDMLQVVTGGN